MRSTNRKRALLISSAVILLCMSIIVGMTYALFTDNITQNHHLQAGTLKAKLTRTDLYSTYLDTDTGLLKKTTDSVDKDFTSTDTRTDNIFGMITKDDQGNVVNTMVVPQSEYTAEMKISNDGNVAFRYWIEVIYKDADGNVLDKNDEFANQVTVTVKKGAATHTEAVFEELEVGDEDSPIGTVEKGKSDTFTVNVKFEDDKTYSGITNNNVMGADISFDIIVYAVQVEAPV